MQDHELNHTSNKGNCKCLKWILKSPSIAHVLQCVMEVNRLNVLNRYCFLNKNAYAQNKLTKC